MTFDKQKMMPNKAPDSILSEGLIELLNSLTDMFLVCNMAGEIIEANSQLLNGLGYNLDKLTGKFISILIPQNRKSEAKQHIGEVIAEKRTSFNIPVINKKGVEIPVVFNLNTLKLNGFKYLLVNIKDASDHQLLEQKYIKIFKNTPALGCIIEFETGFITEVNNAFLNRLKFTDKDIVGKRVADLLKIDDFERAYLKDMLIQEGRLDEIEIFITGKDNKKLPLIISSEMIKINGVDHFYVIGFDVSQRKMAQRISNENEARYRDLFNNMNSGFSYHKIFFKNNKPVDYLFVDVNPKFEQLLGLNRKDVLNKKMSELSSIIPENWLSDLEPVIQYGQPLLISKFWEPMNRYIKLWAYRPRQGYLGVIYSDETKIKESEIKLKKQSLDIKKVIREGARNIGQDYYNNMVLCLNDISKADYTFIGEINDNSIKTIAICSKGKLEPVLSYEINNSPCFDVLNSGKRIFKNNLNKKYTPQRCLADFETEAYVGIPIVDEKEKPIGILVSLYKSPISDTEFIETLFELFAVSIGDEFKRSKTELKQKESEQRFKWLSEATFEGVIMTKNGAILDANEQIQNMFQVRLEELANGTFKELIHPDDYKKVVQKLADKDTEPYEFRGITQSGDVIYLEVNAKEIKVDGEDYRLSVLRDITKQKLIEINLEEREKLLSSIFDSTPAIMMILNEETKVERMNKFGYSYLGNNNFDVTGLRCGDVLSCIGAINDKKGERSSKICQNCIIRTATEDTLSTGIEHLKLETDIVTFFNNNLLIKTFLVSTKLLEQNKQKYVLLTLDDITQRKQMEEELVVSNESAMYNEQRYKLLTDLTFEGIILHRNREIVNINKSFESITGFSSSEIVGLDFVNVIIPLKYHELVKQKLTEDYSPPYEIEILTIEGKLLPVEIEARYFYQNENKIRVTAVRDISERKQAEKRILNAILETEEKERASFAQELHDGLGPILSNIQMYFQWLAEADDNMDFVAEKGNESLKNAFTTLRELSSKLSPHILHNFGLIRALESFIESIPQKVGVRIELINNLENKRYNTNIEITLYRIITELINNTIKYAEATKITINIKEPEQQSVIDINYADNGKGFDIDKINGRAKGFGLYNIESRIKTLFGKIEYNNKNKKGFNLKLIIPINKNE